MQKVIALIFALVPAVVMAGSSTSNVDEFLISTGTAEPRWRVILLAECMGALNDELNALLYAQRKTKSMPDFSASWCIQNKIVPGYGSNDKRS